MQFKTIFVITILIFCISDYVQTKAIQQNKVSLSENIGNIRTNQSKYGSKFCQFSSDCPEHSRCVSGVCECVPGWTTWKDGTFCGYEQKSKMTALILSIVIGGVGADWFYLSNGSAAYIVAGVFKLLMSFGCCCRIFKGDGEGIALCCACAGLIISGGSGVWWLVDWIRILTGHFPDGNGAPLPA